MLIRLVKAIISLFRKPKRDVSRRDSATLDEVAEKLDLEIRPLKPLHRRLTVRDHRLLPKQSRRHVVSGKRKHYMTADEANRLFSASLRNKAPGIRDLATDTAQLQRYGLPLWDSEQALADALGLSIKTLRYFSIHREKERCPHYICYAIPKRRGGERLIMAPKKRLKHIQRQLNERLVSKLPVSACSHGFVKGRSIKTGAQAHVGRRVVVSLDLKDFFPSVTYGRVRGYLIALGYSYSIAATLALLMTEAERQPLAIDDTIYHVPVTQRYCVQGAPTSPGLCNALLLKLDRRLAGLAKSLDFDYSRYADDLTFSSADGDRVDVLLSLARKVIREEGFDVKESKTRIMRQGQRQRVTGITVNDTLGLSRRERRKIRAMLHQHAQSGAADLGDVLGGKMAYLKMLNEEQYRALQRYYQDLGNR